MTPVSRGAADEADEAAGSTAADEAAGGPARKPPEVDRPVDEHCVGARPATGHDAHQRAAVQATPAFAEKVPAPPLAPVLPPSLPVTLALPLSPVKSPAKPPAKASTPAQQAVETVGGQPMLMTSGQVVGADFGHDGKGDLEDEKEEAQRADQEDEGAVEDVEAEETVRAEEEEEKKRDDDEKEEEEAEEGRNAKTKYSDALPSPDLPEAVTAAEREEDEDEDDEDHGSGLVGLTPRHQHLVQRVFAFYAGTDGTSAECKSLGNTRFRTLLRDCGLLGSDAGDGSGMPGATWNTAAVGRRLSAASASSGTRNGRRSSARASFSSGATNSRGALFASAASSAPSAGAPPSSSRSSSGSGLRRASLPNWNSLASTSGSAPSKVFHEPPLNFVHADLTYALAVGATRRQQHQAQVRASGRMDITGFVWALTDIALYCRRQGVWERSGNADAELTTLCGLVLESLDLVLGLGDFDAALVREILAEPDVALLLQAAQRGLDAVFKRHACSSNGPEPYQRGHWTAQSMKKFANDIGLVAELSVATLQRLFDACVEHFVEHNAGKEGMLSFSGFQFVLVMIAQHVHKHTPNCSNAGRLALLFLRLCVATGHRDLGVAAHSVLGTSVPSSLPTRRGLRAPAPLQDQPLPMRGPFNPGQRSTPARGERQTRR